MAVWHPDAKRVVYSDAGALIRTAAPRLTWHTTEGGSLPAYSGSAPHFTLNPKTGDLWQHMPIDRCAKALENDPGGVETNRLNNIQVELIGFAKDTDNWPASYYREIADLARWIERNGGVARTTSVDFEARNHPMSNSAWLGYRGHCGHQHVPEQAHWDPGKFRIDLVLQVDDDPHRHLNVGDSGPDVEAFQRAVNRIARRCCRPDHVIDVDGDFGALSLRHGAWACWLIGMGDDQENVAEGGIGPLEQTYARDYDARSDAVKKKGYDRRARHCKCDQGD